MRTAFALVSESGTFLGFDAEGVFDAESPTEVFLFDTAILAMNFRARMLTVVGHRGWTVVEVRLDHVQVIS